jgi:Tol biopolymer transport system component
MAANGKSQVQMTSYKSGMVSSPEWSPNGKQIAYILSTDLKDGATANRLMLMDVATKKATSIYSYDKVGLLRTLSWSPDGSKIAVSWTAEQLYLDDAGSGFGIVDVKTRKYTNVNLSGNLDPRGAAWSPDGKSIAFIRMDVSSNFAAKTTESVISVKPDGTGGRVLCTQQITNTGEIYLDNLSWAPSGKVLAFTRMDNKAQKNTVYAIDVAAKKAKAFIANATEMDW